MDQEQRKKMVLDTFNTVAPGYDSEALRFFSASATHLGEVLALQGNERILDVATGTGSAALALAERLDTGSVHGVDFAEGMLRQARSKAAARGLRNVLFEVMDMHELALPLQSYDVATCAFGIFFAEDMAMQLGKIAETVKPGGKVAVTGFADHAFRPIVDVFFDKLEKYGVALPPLSWKRIGSEEKVTALFSQAGLRDTTVFRKNVGYHLDSAAQWWDIVWYAGFRGLVNQLSRDDLAKFKQEHLAELKSLASDKGLWLDVEVLFTVGSKP